MNILINRYCNLSCSYCFAKKMLENPSIPNDMSLEDFDYCLDFIERSRDFLEGAYRRQVRVLGGEPTVSKLFSEYAKLIVKRKALTEVMVFSNGLIPSHSMETIFDLRKYKRVRILINSNTPEFLKDRYAELESNIDQLVKNKIDISLGVNISGEDFDYKYIIELLKKHQLKTARWTVVSPNQSDLKEHQPIDYYKKHVEVVLNFLRECFELGIKTNVDCNVIPLCAYSDSQLREIVIYDPESLYRKRCMPVLDIMPNLKVIRCFGTNHLGNCNLRDYDNAMEVFEYFAKNIDKGVNGLEFTKECNKCKLHKRYKCGGGCLAFYLQPNP